MGLRPGRKGYSGQLALLLEIKDGGGCATVAGLRVQKQSALWAPRWGLLCRLSIKSRKSPFYTTVSALVNTSGNADAADILFLFNVVPVQGQGCLKTLYAGSLCQLLPIESSEHEDKSCLCAIGSLPCVGPRKQTCFCLPGRHSAFLTGDYL